MGISGLSGGCDANAQSTVCMRSSIVGYGQADGMLKLKALVKDADVFFANKRPGHLNTLTAPPRAPRANEWVPFEAPRLGEATYAVNFDNRCRYREASP